MSNRQQLPDYPYLNLTPEDLTYYMHRGRKLRSQAFWQMLSALSKPGKKAGRAQTQNPAVAQHC